MAYRLIWAVPQCLPHNRKADKLVVVHEADVSTVPPHPALEPWRIPEELLILSVC